MIVEFLLAFEDGSWETRAVFVEPETIKTSLRDPGDDKTALIKWADDHLGIRLEYRKVVCFGIMGVWENPDEWEGAAYLPDGTLYTPEELRFTT